MNILPKKRWHVRTKENIARVRRDEAKAAQEEKKIQERIKLAERETRREQLLQKSRNTFPSDQFSVRSEKDDQSTSNSSHINFFQDLENDMAESNQFNKEHEREKKAEQEEYEKRIGYLTYLGQDTNEALGKKSWYDIVPDRSSMERGEINMKSKIREDPLSIIKKYVPAEESTINTVTTKNKQVVNKVTIYDDLKVREDNGSIRKKHKCEKKHDDKKKKHKKHKSKRKYSSSSETSSECDDTERKLNLEILRMKRLKREEEERRRSEQFLAKLKGTNREDKKTEEIFVPKYNSQFNPQLAKQNYDKCK